MKLSPQAAAERFNFGHECATDAIIAYARGQDDDGDDLRDLALMTSDELRAAGYAEYSEAIKGVIR